MRMPGVLEAGEGCLYQFAVTPSITSKQFEGFRATTLVRVTAWSAGARRRESSEPKLFARLGDPLGMISVRTPSYDRLSARSSSPAGEEEWMASNPSSFRGAAGVGVTTDAWAPG